MIRHAFAISAYKDSPYIEECLKSVLDQSEKSPVYICTSTETEKLRILSEKYKVRLFVRDGKSSLKDDWNFALETAANESGAPLITVSHQDDVYGRDYAKTVISMYEKYPDMSVFFCDAKTIDKEGKEIKDSVEKVKRLMKLPVRIHCISDRSCVKKLILRFGNPVVCPSCTYNTKLTGLPVFNNDYGFVIDWETLLELAEKKGRFVYSARELILHRVHDGAETRKKIEDNTREAEETAMFEKMWSKKTVAFFMRFYRKAYKAYDLQ